MTGARPRTPPGTRVRFYGDRRLWTVRADEPRWTVLTRQADFKPRGAVFYTIVDWRLCVRGPCNLIGQGWNFTDGRLDEDAALLLAALRRQVDRDAYVRSLPHGSVLVLDETAGEFAGEAVEVSHRNRVGLHIEEIRR